MNKISIIVPVYNAEAFLEECIESVLCQTYENLELLLVDDKSTDRSAAICKSYAKKDERIRFFSKSMRGGVSSARNFGLKNATGQYIMFLDADDQLTPDCAEVLLKYMIERQADIVAGRTVNSAYQWRNEQKYEIWNGTRGLEESLKDNPYCYSAWGKLYRADFIGESRFREEYRINEDSFFVFELLLKKPVFIAVKNEIYSYRFNSDSSTHQKFGDKFFDILKISDEQYELIKSCYPEYLDLAENMRLKAKMNMLRILAIKTNGEYRKLEKELQRDIIRNGQYYQPGIPSDDKWFWVIKCHMYKAYAYVKRKKRE